MESSDPAPHDADLWQEAVGELCSVEEYAALTGMSMEHVRAEIDLGTYITVTFADGRTALPRWQADLSTEAQGLLAKTFSILVQAPHGRSDWTAAAWMAHRHPELAGTTPAAYAQKGEHGEHLLDVARDDAQAWSR